MFWMKKDVCQKLYLVKVTDFDFYVKFCVKVFEIPIYDQCVCSVGLMFGMMIDTCPKFYSVPPPPMRVTYRLMSL